MLLKLEDRFGYSTRRKLLIMILSKKRSMQPFFHPIAQIFSYINLSAFLRLLYSKINWLSFACGKKQLQPPEN